MSMILLISGGRNGKGLLNEPRRWGVDSHVDNGLIQTTKCTHLLSSSYSDLEYDPEVFADQELPILIVGTKHVSTHSSGVSKLSKLFVSSVYGVLVLFVRTRCLQ